jgi:hypothetical protein
MKHDQTMGTDRRIFMKRAAGTMLAAGMSARAFARRGFAGPTEKRIYPERWVYVSRSFDRDQHVEEVREIARVASEHGLTAIVLSGMDRISLGSAEYLERLRTSQSDRRSKSPWRSFRRGSTPATAEPSSITTRILRKACW